MSQAVGTDFAQNTVSGADTLDALLHKGIAEVLLSESNQPVIGFQQVCDDYIPVIIAVQVLHSEDGVRLVLRQHGQNRGVLAKQENRRQGDAFYLPFGVFQNQPGAAQQFFIR